MAGLNRAIICGNLGKDPEIRYSKDGHAIANLNVCTNETWTKDGFKQERAEWHKIVVFGNQADVCKNYLHKGDQALFEGKLQTRKWQDQQGVERYTTEIILNGFNSQIVLLNRANRETTHHQQQQGSLGLNGGSDHRTPAGYENEYY